MVGSSHAPRARQHHRAHVLDGLVVATIAAIATVQWCFRILLPAHIPFDLLSNSDFFTQIYPMWVRTAEWWRAGVLPLWNPYQYAGHPLLATGIYGVLYPPNVLYWLLPADLAIEVLAVVHLIVAGVGMYAYARTIALGRMASLVAGVTFMLSGFVVSQAAWFPPALAAAVWLPLALLAIERLFRRADVVSAIVLAAAVALSFLGGWPQTWMYAMYVVAVYGLARFIVAALSAAERPHLVRASVLAVAAMVLALAWMSPQLLPSAELQALGPRRSGSLSMRQIMSLGPLVPSRLAATMLDAVPGRPRWAYVGLSALLLMPLSLLAIRQRWRAACLWLLAAFSLCVAVSVYTPVFRLYSLIGGSGFRAPPRILYIYAAVASVLAGMGFDVVARLAERRGAATVSDFGARSRWLVAGIVTAVAITAAVCETTPVLSRLYLGVTVVLVSGALFAPSPLARRALIAALATFMVVDLVLAIENPFMHPLQRRGVYDEQTAAFDFIKAHQGFDRTYIKASMDFPEWMSKQGSLREIFSITDYEPLSLSRYERFFHAVEAPKDRIPDYLTFTGLLSADPSWPEFRLLDLLSVKFTLVQTRDVGAHVAFARLAPKWLRVLSTREGTAVYQNSNPLPRAYVTQHAIVEANEDTALAATTTASFDPRTSVVLELEGVHAITAATSPLPIVPARITRYEPARVEVDVDAPAHGYLVLTDTFYPGWQATVDGVATPIARANFLFRAVPVDAGKHTVTFSYRPRSFWIGAGAALLGLIVAALALARERRQRGRERVTRRQHGVDTPSHVAATSRA